MPMDLRFHMQVYEQIKAKNALPEHDQGKSDHPEATPEPKGVKRGKGGKAKANDSRSKKGKSSK